MSIKGFIRDLVPPILMRVLRPKPAVAQAVRLEAGVHTVKAGPLKGTRLLVNAVQPAFLEMIAGSYDAYLWDPMPAHLEDGILLDVGAHIGYHTMGLAAKYPQCKVVAFEPNPANLVRLNENLGLNPSLSDRVEIMAAALSDVEGTLSFRSSTNVEDQTSSGGYLERGKPPLDAAIYERSGFASSEVPAHRLDELSALHGWTGIRLMKVDVEGAEHLVLKGAMEVLRRDHPMLLMEVHSVVCMLEVLKLLHPLGYDVQLLHEDRPSRCFVVARWKA